MALEDFSKDTFKGLKVELLKQREETKKAENSYTSVTGKLDKISQAVNAIYDELKKQVDENFKKYSGEYIKQETEKATSVSMNFIAEQTELAKKVLQSMIDVQQTRIDNKYMANISPEILADLQVIDQSELSENELNGYLRKFKDDYPAIRRLEAIIKQRGYYISGLSYDYETDFMNDFVKKANELIGYFDKDNGVTRNIIIRLLESKSEEYAVKESQAYEIKYIG